MREETPYNRRSTNKPLVTRHSSLATPKRGPEPLGEILSRLFIARGWGRRQERMRLEAAWFDAVGEASVEHTKLGTLRRGILEVFVDNAVLLQELAHYHKRRLLEKLRGLLAGVTLTDIRFRAGAWETHRQ